MDITWFCQYSKNRKSIFRGGGCILDVFLCDNFRQTKSHLFIVVHIILFLFVDTKKNRNQIVERGSYNPQQFPRHINLKPFIQRVMCVMSSAWTFTFHKIWSSMFSSRHLRNSFPFIYLECNIYWFHNFESSQCWSETYHNTCHPTGIYL